MAQLEHQAERCTPIIDIIYQSQHLQIENDLLCLLFKKKKKKKKKKIIIIIIILIITKTTTTIIIITILDNARRKQFLP